MPLPDSAPLSLQVNSSAVQSRPKRAMIVRMSAETLEALEAFPNHPPLSFDFGDSPGIYIGDAFFPMRPQKESSPHELYLRATSAAKPMAPLKLYANVIGKFMVERQLGDKVTGKVRQQTMVAKQQHLERQAILLDQPPIPAPGAKNAKRKVPGSGTVIRKTPASEQLRLASSSAVASRKVSPLPQNTPSSKASADVRRRLVHCLAISPRLAEEALRLVGGAKLTDSARDDLLALLGDVAEQQAPSKKSDNSPRSWVLKPQTWTEVRPFEWPKLTEQERTTMARQARYFFNALKIPESDPAWDNVRYRATAPAIQTSVSAVPSIAATTTSRSTTSAQAETKRSAITTKEAKQKSKQDVIRSKGEIQVKDESTKATVPRMDAIKRAEADRPSTASDSSTAAKTVASRRHPGSGYHAKKSPQSSTASREKTGSPIDARPASKPSVPSSIPSKPPTGGTHARKTVPAVPPKPVKREDESDRERDREYERQREREREKRAREKERQREEREREQERIEMERREKVRQKQREAVEREKRQREKEREREEMEQEKRQREKERIAKEKAASGAAPAFKRKAPNRDADDTLADASSKSSLSKRRKLDDGASVASSSKSARDPGPPKKPVRESSPVPRLKMKKDPSPPQASTLQERRTAAGSMHKSERLPKASGAAKSRRRSPIYTSSEDEGEIPQPRKRNPSPPPVSDRSISSDQPSERAPRYHRPTRTTYPPPNDHAALRALYQSQYTNYLGTFSKVVAQKRKIEAILNGDSDAEMDVMDLEELHKLSDEHKSLKTELEHIHSLFTRGTAAVHGGGMTSE